MNWTLLRRDPGLRGSGRLLLVVLLAAGVSTTGWGVLVFSGEEQLSVPYIGLPLGPVIFASMVWVALMGSLFLPGVVSRCQLLDLALPVSARQLWLTHLITIVLMGWATLAAMTGLLSLFNLLLGRLVDRALLGQGLGALMLHMAAGLVLAVVLMQRVKPELYRIPIDGRYIFQSILTTIGVLILILVLHSLSSFSALITLGLALILGMRTCSSLPPAFALLSRQAEDGGEVRESEDIQASSGEASIAGFRWIYFKTVWRTLISFRYAFFLPILIGYGLIVSGLFPQGLASSDMRIVYLGWIWYLMLSFALLAMRQLHFLDYLPISRKLLFAGLVLPVLLSVMLGYGIGALGDLRSEPYRRHDRRTDLSHLSAPVAVENFAIAWDGQVAEIGSPWGESHPAWSFQLCKGSRITLYAPYTSPEGSSRKFAALQLSRAIAAFHGEQVPLEEVAIRYLASDEEGKIHLQTERLLADYPGLLTPGQKWYFPVFLLVAVFPWLLLMVFMLRVFRTNPPEREWNWLMIGAMALAFLITIGTIAADIAGYMGPGSLPALTDALIWQLAEEVPGGGVVIWATTILLLGGGYLQGQTEFQRYEIPSRREKTPGAE